MASIQDVKETHQENSVFDPEYYRLKARAERLGLNDTPQALYYRIQESLDQWLRPKEFSKEHTMDLLCLEQFLEAVPPNMQLWIKQHHNIDILEAVDLATAYQRTQDSAASLAASNKKAPAKPRLSNSVFLPFKEPVEAACFGVGGRLARQPCRESIQGLKTCSPVHTGLQCSKCHGVGHTACFCLHQPSKENMAYGTEDYPLARPLTASRAEECKDSLDARVEMEDSDGPSQVAEVWPLYCRDDSVEKEGSNRQSDAAKCGISFPSHHPKSTGSKEGAAAESSPVLEQRLAAEMNTTLFEDWSDSDHQGSDDIERQEGSPAMLALQDHANFEGGSVQRKKIKEEEIEQSVWQSHYFEGKTEKSPLFGFHQGTAKSGKVNEQEDSSACNFHTSEEGSPVDIGCGFANQTPNREQCSDETVLLEIEKIIWWPEEGEPSRRSNRTQRKKQGPSRLTVDQCNKPKPNENKAADVAVQPQLFACTKCCKFSIKDTDRHCRTATNTEENPFLCKVCKKSVRKAAQNAKYRQARSGTKPFVCNECGKNFTHLSILNKHRRMHTGEKPFTCLKCDKCFSQSSTLAAHQRIHTGEKHYTCSECGKSFNRSSTLNAHHRVHTGEKRYSCEVCGKNFSQSSTLVKHKRIHTGEKPYLCGICGKHFSQTSSLNTHQRLHTGEKPYSCSICQETFSRSSYLAEHQQLHTGEKLFACNVCGRSFSRSSNLVRHQQVHRGQKLRSDGKNKKGFHRSSDLIKHEQVRILVVKTEPCEYQLSTNEGDGAETIYRQ